VPGEGGAGAVSGGAVTGDYALGMLALAAIAVSLAFAGRAIRRALLPGWSGSPALLATGVIGLGLLVVISQLLGLVGILDGVLLTAACLIVGAAAYRLEPKVMPQSLEGRAKMKAAGALGGAGQRDAPATDRVQLIGALAVAGLVALQWAGPSLLALDRGIYGGDSLWYHMPFAAHMAQTGSVTELLFTDPLYLNWFYPQNSELLHADGLMLLGNDLLSPLLNLGWLALALLAAWCIGRPYGAGAPAVAAVGALMSANLLFSRQPGNANNDVVAIALLLASVAILINARQATTRGPLFVAGLAAGLALGTKLTVVPPVGALTIGVVVIAASGTRLRAAAAWVAGLAAGGGLWYFRDLVVAHTPFPFVDIGPLSKPEELAGREPFAIVHYLTDTNVWGAWFTPGLEERLGDLWPLFLAAAVLGVVLWLWRAERLERMLAAVALIAALAYLVTPLGASGPEGMPRGFRLNIRYLAPGLGLALVLCAMPPPLLAGRERWWRIGAFAGFAGLTLINVVSLEPIDSDRLPGSVLLAGAVVALPAALVLLWRRGAPRPLIAAVAIVPLLALLVLGRVAQDDYLDQRYSSAAPEYPREGEQPSTELSQGLGAAYDWARGVEDADIALSGTTGALFQYGLWGQDSSNSVTFIGEREDRGAFREIDRCPEWIEAINRGGFDYVVTTPAYDQDDPESATQPIEFSWIGGSGGVRHVLGTTLVDVWELTGPIDPASCGRVPPRGKATPGLPAD
jgi:hypothetical protein